MLPPAEWYAKQDLSQHYMRDTLRPFEEGVSRGQLRLLNGNYEFAYPALQSAYAVIADNRMAKGRAYSMRLLDLWFLQDNGELETFGIAHQSLIIAAAICVIVKPDTLYVSAWGHISGDPIPMLCKFIYEWCRERGFKTLDIGIGGEPGLDDFKRRLGFRRACDAQ